jgi:hypothetical protein
MWISPRYINRVQDPTPPTDIGQRTASFSGGPDTELCIAIESGDGRPSVLTTLRRWTLSEGEWLPIRSVSVRRNEARELAEGLYDFSECRRDVPAAPPRPEPSAEVRSAGVRLVAATLPYGEHGRFVAETGDAPGGGVA